MKFEVYLEISTSERVYPFKVGLLLVVDLAPRKFKNLGTDAFIASKFTEFFQLFRDVNAIKV